MLANSSLIHNDHQARQQQQKKKKSQNLDKQQQQQNKSQQNIVNKQQQQRRQQQQKQSNENQEIVNISAGPHPLEHSWSFWIYKLKSTDFQENLTHIQKDINTVEEFWQLMLLIKEVNKLPRDCGYYFFKKNIRPMWEDDANSSGGRWLITNRRHDRASEIMWREILLSLVGEQFGQYNDHIAGAFVVRKSFADRVGVWTMQCQDKEACLSIGRLIKKKTKVRSLVYEAHDPKQNVSYTV